MYQRCMLVRTFQQLNILQWLLHKTYVFPNMCQITKWFAPVHPFKFTQCHFLTWYLEFSVPQVFKTSFACRAFSHASHLHGMLTILEVHCHHHIFKLSFRSFSMASFSPRFHLVLQPILCKNLILLFEN